MHLRRFSHWLRANRQAAALGAGNGSCDCLLKQNQPWRPQLTQNIHSHIMTQRSEWKLQVRTLSHASATLTEFKTKHHADKPQHEAREMSAQVAKTLGATTELTRGKRETEAAARSAGNPKKKSVLMAICVLGHPIVHGCIKPLLPRWQRPVDDVLAEVLFVLLRHWR